MIRLSTTVILLSIGIHGAVSWSAAAQDVAARNDSDLVEVVPEDPVGSDTEHRVVPELLDAGPPLYYSVERNATLYAEPDSSKGYLELQFREPVFLIENRGAWYHVSTKDGVEGYVPARSVSNVWIRVSKAEKTLFVYRGTELISTIRADFGINAFSDKVKRGSSFDPDHWRTPEGTFYVVRKNPNSQFYKALVLNYPTADDAERGRRENLITEAQYRAIVRADREQVMPPMNTPLGGLIEIHGKGTGAGVNWTMGCVAVHDYEIDRLWRLTHVGTPVLIE